MNKFFHPFHLVTVSPWPILTSLRVINNLLITINWFNKINYIYIITIPCTLICAYQWWRDVIRESTFQGFHTFTVYKGLRIGIILFITSEVLFFFSFFWAFYHSSLSPSIEIGQCWPPLGITPFNPYDIPLLNTIILISSGISITWCHHSMINKDFPGRKCGLLITVLLGLYFTLLQAFEYFEAAFSITDSVYGSTFFIATGFHGLHVIIGTSFLIVCLFRLYSLHFSPHHHFGFEAAAWYWHFVDVVWLFLYISIYWWTY